jgi:2-polyprenyl-3-methyl-5-hydroxy-6-metoxy-1,4-benzoquinol methylase
VVARGAASLGVDGDPTVFAGTAQYYRQGRPPYAPGLVEALAGELGLDGRGRLLDVGCGPGIITIAVAHLFEAVIGVDADEAMLVEARRAAQGEGVTNANG